MKWSELVSCYYVITILKLKKMCYSIIEKPYLLVLISFSCHLHRCIILEM